MLINNSFIRRYTPFVRSIAASYRFVPTVSQDDLIQEGFLGLIEAADRFDPNAGTPFEAYAKFRVRKYMLEFLQRYANVVAIPDQNREATDSCITESLDTPLYEEDGDIITFSDIVTDGVTPESQCIRQEIVQALHHHLSLLNRQEQIVICALYGLENDKIYSLLGLNGKRLTTKELAIRLSLSVDRIRKIHQHAIHKLREKRTSFS